jgi:CubicO group peptidase (beta-lactamase class C family)
MTSLPRARWPSRTALVLCLCAGCAVPAAPPPSADPAVPVQASAPTLEIPPVGRIDSVFARFSAPGSPGCVLTVMRAGDVVLARAYGVANRETGEPLSTSTLIDAGSLTKQFTAFGVAMLAAEGRLSLDDDVRAHLPELPAYPHRVTLRHLLHQASGLREYTELSVLAANGLTGTELLEGANGLSFAPGDRYLYSNSGYLLLGRVVERVSGRPLAAFLHERIFRPLGMADTRLAMGSADVRGRAHAYARGDTGWVHQDPPVEPGSGDFGLVTTPADLARWDRNFYDGRVGGDALRVLRADSLRMKDGTLSTYRFGLHLEPYRGLRRDWHGGQSFGFRAQWWRFPDQRISLLTTCNTRTAEPDGLTERVANLFLARDLAAAGRLLEPEMPVDSADAARYFGFYVSRPAHQSRFVTWRDGRFGVRYVATWYDLVPAGPGRFRVRGQPIELAFRPDADGTMLLEERAGDAAPTVYRWTDQRATAPPLDDLAGTYRSAELGTVWRMEVRRDTLVAMLPRDTTRLQRAGPDAFSDGYVLVLFDRDAAGRVTGFGASTPRTLGVPFTRDP